MHRKAELDPITHETEPQAVVAAGVLVIARSLGEHSVGIHEPPRREG